MSKQNNHSDKQIKSPISFFASKSSIGSYAIFFFWVLLALNLIAAAWYVLHGDLHFQTDIARDFLILAEIEQKKLILIGARAGAAGLFHGVFWPYFNFPAYFIGNGNPVVVAWWWIVCSLVFMWYSFRIAKRLFNQLTAYLYVLLTSAYLVFQTKEFTHPQGAMLLVPGVFYMFWQYIQTLKPRYLVLFVLGAGLLIQLEMAFGMPFFILAALYILVKQIQQKKFYHVFTFLLILIPLSTFIIFDIRHDFFLTKSYLAYVKGQPWETYNFARILQNRLDYMTTLGAPLLYSMFTFGEGNLNRLFFVVFFAVLIWVIARGERRLLYLTFLYFFLGYFIFSLTNRYYLLSQHFIAFVPMVLMFFVSLVTTKNGKVLAPFILFILIFNVYAGFMFMTDAKTFIGKNEDSWKVLAQIANDIYAQTGEEFGYFVYAPDKFAYEPKYAMVYGQKQHPQKQAYYFQKKPVTYVVSAPPPPNNPFMHDEWWTVNSIKIDKTPQSVFNYPNGYKVERYKLTPEEITVPWDRQEDSGLHFR